MMLNDGIYPSLRDILLSGTQAVHYFNLHFQKLTRFSFFPLSKVDLVKSDLSFFCLLTRHENPRFVLKP